MSQTMRLDRLLRLDASDVLSSVVRMLGHYESGGRADEQEAAARLLRDLHGYAADAGVLDVGFVGEPDTAAALLEAVRDDVASGWFGPLPRAVRIAVMQPFG